MYVSYRSDAFGVLLDAVLVLLRTQQMDSICCSWQEEPGEYRWLLHREGERVRVQILHVDDTFSRLPNERGRCCFETTCTLVRLATQIKGQLHQMLNEHGEEGYRKRWRHPFPTSAFRELETLIRHVKSGIGDVNA